MEISKIRLVISQPKVRKAPSEWDCSIEELTNDIRFTSERAKHCMEVISNEKPENYVNHLRPGEKQCAYCKAAADCPKYAEVVAHYVFNTDDMPTVDPDSEVQPEVYVPVTPELLSSRFLAVALIRKWCDVIEEKVLEAVKSGVIGPAHGLKPIAGREGNRTWADEAKAEELLKSFKMKHDEMFNYSLISPTKALESLSENPRRLKKVSELIVRKPGGIKVVHVSDKHPALAIGAYAAADMPEVEMPETQAPVQESQNDSGDDLI